MAGPEARFPSVTSSIPRIGYVPYSSSLAMPGDRRRFVAYARARNLPFELARPKERYDIVVLSELADISIWCDYPYGKVVYDLIDSYLAIPRTDWKQMLRGPVWFATGRHKRLRFDYKETIETMCRRADAVICTTQEQKQDIEAFCPNVHIVLDIHDTVVRAIKHDYSAVRPFNLVWEGLPSNIPQLESVSEVLRTIARSRPLILHIVSDPDRPRLLGHFGRIRSIDAARKIFENIRFHHWDEITCSNIIAGCDTAIIPINLDDPFTAGKPENKLLLLWRMGLPVVASAIQSYSRAFAAVGMPHLACKTSDDWIAALELLVTDESERRRAGQEGRIFAEQHWNRTRLLSLWDKVFMSLGNDMVNLVRFQTAAS